MVKLRMKITKEKEIRFIAHLDYARAIERAVRRANLPASYSEGFNPHMKIAFASALGVGVASEAEYVDLELKREVAINDVIAKLAGQLPPGIKLKQAKYISLSSPALMASVNLAEYSVDVSLGAETDKLAIADCVEKFNQAKEVRFVRNSPKGYREIRVKEYVNHLSYKIKEAQLNINFTCKITPQGTIKPSEVIECLVNSFGLPIDKDAVSIYRMGLFIVDNGAQLSPLEMA